MTARLLLVTGEVSGDLHAAGVIRELRRRRPDLRCAGTGGEALRAEGVEILHDAREMAVVGGAEAIWKYRHLLRVFTDLRNRLESEPPDVVLLVDYPGFNLRFAAAAHARGIRTVYFICPQVWAWRRGRIPRMARILDRLITIFPFEPALFEGTGLRADFAGHPFVDETRRLLANPPAALPWAGPSPRIALLPGSRPREIARLLPVFWRAAAQLDRRLPQPAFLFAAPHENAAAQIRAGLARLGAGPRRWDVAIGRTREVLRQADAAAVASGTATLEAAFFGCPTVVTYRTDLLTEVLARLLVRVPYLGIVNLLAGREVCPELLQRNCRPDRLAEALAPLAVDSDARRAMREALAAVVAGLGGGGAYAKAAALVDEELDRAVAARGRGDGAFGGAGQ